MATPKYNINDIIYLRESAALGFLEAVRISGVYKKGAEWLYTIYAGIAGAANANYYGDRRTLVNGSILHFTESELISEYDALLLTKANLQRQLDKIEQQINTKYP
jgi:hypothetical protein